MTIDHFSTEEFEEALMTRGYPVHALGFISGEYVVSVEIEPAIEIRIRSSIWRDGHSAPKGKDSIRLFLWDRQRQSPISTDLLGVYVTRVPGWQERLVERIEYMKGVWKKVGYCDNCKMPKRIYRARTKQNYGRPFAKCFECDSGFIWLDEEK